MWPCTSGCAFAVGILCSTSPKADGMVAGAAEAVAERKGGIGVPSFSIAAESSSTEILPEPSASNDAKTARISVTSSADIRFPWSSGLLKTAPPRGAPAAAALASESAPNLPY